jgi:predicted DNA binding protein
MSGRSRAVLLDLEYTHDCWCIDCTRHLEGSAISMVEGGFSYKDSTTGLFSLTGAEPKRFARQLKRHPWVRDVTLLEASPSGALATIRFKRNSLVAESVAQAGCVPLEPSMTKAQTDHLTVLVPKESQLAELTSMLKERTEGLRVKARTYLDAGKNPLQAANAGDFLKLSALSAGMPAKQRAAFLLACDRGYYDHPKRVTLEELAAEAGVHKATLAEHLQKVEARLMPFFAKSVRHLAPTRLF